MAAQATTWSTAALLLVCSGLATIVGLEVSEELPIAPEVTAAAPVALDLPPEQPLTYRSPPAGEFDVIAERPLFSASRRPFVPEVAEEAAPAPEAGPDLGPPEVELVGVMLSEERRAALMAPAAGGQPQWLYEGQSWEGWVIEGIEPDRATLRQGERSAVLELRSD